MTRAPIVLRLAAIASLVVAVFAAGASVWKGERPVPFPEAQAEASEEATVRISAKRLESGRTEFGLQVRSDGAWGPQERLLPRSRMFPANAEVGRWLRSSPLELDSGHVVWITAQLLENGRIEFGLHEVISGELGERLLPRSRMFPTNPTVGRWLNSSSLVLSVQTEPEEPMAEESSETDDPNTADTEEPAWTPITEAQSGITDTGAQYWVDYPDWLDGERRTIIMHEASEGAVPQDGDPAFFRVICQAGVRFFQVGNTPPAEGEYAVRSRVDDSDWTDATWRMWLLTPGSGSANPALDYESLRSGETLMIEIALDPVFRATFDLAALFGTPLQANIDNCGIPVWPEPEPPYVPLVNVDGSSSESLRWNARLLGDDLLSNVTNLALVADSPRGVLQLTNTCFRGERFLNIDELERTDAEFLNLMLEIDGVSLPVEAWAVEPVTHLDGTEVSSAAAPNAARLSAQLRNASTLTVTFDGSGMPPVTFDLAGMFDTPIQGNIDNCGNYAPGLSLGLNTAGQVEVGDDGDRVNWIRLTGPAAIPYTSVAWAGPAKPGSLPPFYLMAHCGSAGSFMLLFGTRLGELSAGALDVSWSVDGMPAQRETWRVSEFQNGFMVAHAVSLPPVLQAWRSGQTLELSVHNATSHSQQIDLTAFFGTPVQTSLDECLAAPVPDLPAPGGEVSRTWDGDLYYHSGKEFGNHVAATALSITVGESIERQFLEIACGISSIQVTLGNVSRDQVLVITDDTVEVTWSSDGGDRQTATWDIWWGGDNRGQISVSPPDDAAFYDAIKDADSLNFSVATDPLSTAEFDLAGSGFWSTPVQPNLDACPGS